MHGLTAYGHSWVAGDGASRPACRLVDVVARRLGFEPTNLGVGGSSSTETADLVGREPPPASRVYLVMTGLNDARRHGAAAMALDSYTAAMDTILAAFHEANPAALTVAVEQPHLADYSLHTPHDRGSDAIIDAYNQRLRAVARGRPDVVLASVPGWDPARMLAADKVHPNDAGHAALGVAILNAAAAARSR